MANNEPVTTLIGNVCGDPVQRVTKNGTPVTNFRIASTPRHFDRDAEAWKDGETLFMDVACWRGLGDSVAQCVRKGQPVIVHGRLTSHTYESNEQLRYVTELMAISVGHDLSRGTARFERTARAGSVPTHQAAGPSGEPLAEPGAWFDAESAGGPATDPTSSTDSASLRPRAGEFANAG